MAVDWEIHGLAFGNCNCDYSCPCQFEALPTYGDCKGTNYYRIESGEFDNVCLNGLRMGAVYAWPGPIFEGKGKCQVFIDSNANEIQRDALVKISMGKEAEPFSNIFTVFAAMCDELYDPIFTEIDFEVDMGKRTAKCAAHGICESFGKPIIGASGNEHRAQICLPEGVGFRIAEIGSGRCTASGKIKLEIDDGYGQFNEFHLNQKGVIR